MKKSKIKVILVVILLCISLLGGYYCLPIVKNKEFVDYDESGINMVYNNKIYTHREVVWENIDSSLMQGSDEEQEQFHINYPVKAWDFEYKPEYVKELGLGKYNTIANTIEHKNYFVFGRYMIENSVRYFDGFRHFYKNLDYKFPELLPENIVKIDLVKTIVYCMNMQEQLKTQDGDPRVFLENYYWKSTVLKSFHDENTIHSLIDGINKNGSTKAFFQGLENEPELSDYWDDDYPLFYLRLHFKDQTVPVYLAVYWYV